MRITTSLALAGLAIAATPAAPSAQPLGGFLPGAAPNAVTGLYIGGAAGANWREQQELRAGPFGGRGAFNGPNGRANFLAGWAGVVSLGWGFGNGLRVELEGNYRENEVESVKGFGFQTGFNRAGGFQRTYGFMGNAFYDFRIPALPWFTPYVGAGAGYAWTELRNVRFANPVRRQDFNIGGTEANFAYQAIGGVAFNIREVPGLALTLEYRYFATLNNDFGALGRFPATGESAGGRITTTNQNHSAMLGIRYAFNAPRPAAVVAAPAAQPAPAGVARTYLVFFDWDRADLTDRARQIIAEAATNARTARSTRIEVSGHADRSGTPQYNQRLSERRAEAVAAELARRGIQRSEMATQAFGETRPLVPTADGVREPQNRRVEIVLR